MTVNRKPAITVAVIAMALVSSVALAGPVDASSTGTANVAACEDVSPSFSAEVRTSFNEALIEQLAAHATAAAPKIRSGAAPRRAMNVIVRPIGKGSYGSANTFEIRLAALPGVTAFRDGEAVDETIKRIKARKVRSAAAAENNRRLDVFRSALLAWEPPVRKGSDITGCVLAAGQLLGNSTSHLYIVTDLEATSPPPTPAPTVLQGVKVTIVLACTNAKRCDQLASEWTGHITALGAASVVVVRPEQIADIVRLPQ